MRYYLLSNFLSSTYQAFDTFLLGVTLVVLLDITRNTYSMIALTVHICEGKQDKSPLKYNHYYKINNASDQSAQTADTNNLDTPLQKDNAHNGSK